MPHTLRHVIRVTLIYRDTDDCESPRSEFAIDLDQHGCFLPTGLAPACPIVDGNNLTTMISELPDSAIHQIQVQRRHRMPVLLGDWTRTRPEVKQYRSKENQQKQTNESNRSKISSSSKSRWGIFCRFSSIQHLIPLQKL
jgi:hypothetical protein